MTTQAALRVPMYDHATLYRRRKDAIDGAILRVLESGRLDWGEEVPAFEAAFAQFVGASHCVTVNSGTAALKVALMALGIGPGDEVITVPNTDIGTVSAIRHVGAAPVLADVDPASLCMDVAAARAAVTPRTRAILPVDLYGHPADLPAIVALAQQHGLAVVEDACLALGATIGGTRLGSFATITCFSFAPTKHLGSIGSGGAAATQDAALADRMRKLAAYGQDRSRHLAIHGVGIGLHHETDGLNERMDEIQAAVLRVKLSDVEESLSVRRHQADLYARHLTGVVELPSQAQGTQHAFRNHVVHTDRRDAVRAALTRRGIASNLSYAPPMHLQPVFSTLGHAIGSFPIAERSCARLLGLPVGPHLDDAAIVAVSSALRASVEEVAHGDA